jgi:hypothetical protein
MHRGYLTVFVCLSLFSVTLPLEAQRFNRATSGGYSSRTLTLPRRYLRIDLNPSDYGYMDHVSLTPFTSGPNFANFLNNDRGFRIGVVDADDVYLSLGTGMGYGILDELEVGGLLFPFLLHPNFDFGDMELYGRYAFLKGDAQLGVQLTIQIPTHTDFGIGFGLPAQFTIGSSARIDTGLELELIFTDDESVNLDIPFALSFDVGRSGFLGLRSGIILPDMDEAAINLGAQGGLNIDGTVDLSASFNWPYFIWTGREDKVNPDTFEIVLGASIFIGV